MCVLQILYIFWSNWVQLDDDYIGVIRAWPDWRRKQLHSLTGIHTMAQQPLMLLSLMLLLLLLLLLLLPAAVAGPAAAPTAAYYCIFRTGVVELLLLFFLWLLWFAQLMSQTRSCCKPDNWHQMRSPTLSSIRLLSSGGISKLLIPLYNAG